MKFVILFAVLSLWTVDVMAQNPLQWAAILAVRGMCMVKTGVEEDQVQKVRSWDFSSTDMQLQRYVYCVYKDLRLMDREGNINKEFAMKVLPDETDSTKFSQAVDACKSQTGASKYEKAYNILKCYNTKYPNDIIAL